MLGGVRVRAHLHFAKVFRQIATTAGVPAGASMILRLELVEQAFGRFVWKRADNRPDPIGKFPMDRESAATLLILREFMHHLQCVAAAWRTRMGETALERTTSA